jgi:hypothetical protein
MKRYKNRNGNSGVTHYESGEDFISLRFTGSSKIYTYNYKITGKKHVEKMKKLADSGVGLSTYISQHPEVKNNFFDSH